MSTLNNHTGDTPGHDRAEPIFILGILPRSGTNFLSDLLLLHPDLSPSRDPVNEDLFLAHSDHLTAFVEAVHAAWDPLWGTFGSDLLDRLHADIGEGLVSFLWTDRSRRLVTKSPSVRHLDRFFTFFPAAQLLILVRDGRSVVQSATATFGWDFDRACRAWAEAAQTIQHFQRSESAGGGRWRLVRYEDLVDDPDGQLQLILEFLGLDPERYDFAAARNLPVRGSSSYGRHEGRIHWQPVAKDRSFAPKERWRSWSAAQLERFDWLAGQELVQFGYAGSLTRFTRARSVIHSLRDWKWWASKKAFAARVRLFGRHPR
jgi:protein-tyrosine sulfotransferase